MKETEACKNMEIGNLRLMCSDLGKVRIQSSILIYRPDSIGALRMIWCRLGSIISSWNWTILKVTCITQGQYRYKLVLKMTRLELSGLEMKRSWTKPV